MLRLSWLILAGVFIAFAVWCVLSLGADISQMSFAPLWRSWDLVLIALGLTFFNYALRITRWRWYLMRFGHHLPLGFSALTYVAGFAFTLSPGKLGEMMRARYYTAIRIPLRDVMAAFCTERLMDFLALLLLTLLVLRDLPRYHKLIAVAGSIIAMVIALVVLFPSHPIASLLKSSPHVPKRVAEQADRALTYLAAARSLLSPWRVVVGLFLAVGAWGFEGLGLAVLGSIFSPVGHDALTSVGIYAVAVLIGALSFLPAGLGGTETVMTTLLVNRGYSVIGALLTALACRITTLWLGVGLGWVAVGVLRYGARYEAGLESRL